MTTKTKTKISTNKQEELEKEYIKNPWMFQGKPFTSEQLKGFAGFIYVITDKTDGKKYIGRKYASFSRKEKNATRRTTKESDWKTYFGSSKELQKLIDEKGKDKFSREIIVLCKSKGETNFAEVMFQMLCGVLESDKWHNDAINKWRKTNVSKYTSLSSIRQYVKDNLSD